MDASFAVAITSLVLSFAGFGWNFMAIRREQNDRQEQMSSAWAFEWAAQRSVVYPLLLADWLSGRPDSRYGHANQGRLMPLKNGGRGPALNVSGILAKPQPDGNPVEHQVHAGIIAAGDHLDARIEPPLQNLAVALDGAELILRFSDLAGCTYETCSHFGRTSSGEIDVEMDAPVQTGGPQQSSG